jgi:Leucine-rich repeat (LRR) protein
MRKLTFILLLLVSAFIQAQNFVEDFGSGEDSNNILYSKTEYLEIIDFNNQGNCPPLKPQDGMFIITSNLGVQTQGDNCFRMQGDLFFDSWHKTLTDHTENFQGKYIIVNGSTLKNVVFERKIEGLEKGKTYNFSAWVANLLNLDKSPCKNQTSNFEIPVILNFEVYENEQLVFEKSTPSIYSQSDIMDVWKKYELEFMSTSESHKIIIRNISTGGCGNDFAIDDISLKDVNATCELPWVEIRTPQKFEKWNSVLTALTKDDLLFEWMASEGGIITSEPNKNIVNISTPGLYTVKVTNPKTGCSNSRTVRLIPEDMYPFFQIVSNENLGCGKDKVKLEIKESYDNSFYDKKWINNIEGIEYTDNPLLIYATKPGNYMFLYEPKEGNFSIPMVIGFEVFNGTTKPIGKSIQYYKKGQTLGDLVVEGQNIKWYDSVNTLDALANNVLLVNEKKYFATQTINNCESLERLEVQVLNWETSDSSEIIIFKDAKLKKALVDSKLDGYFYNVALNREEQPMLIDTNRNGEIEISEALNVQMLSLQNLSISNLEGLQYFKNLRTLIVSDNQVFEMNLKGLDNLNDLLIDSNKFTDLDVSYLTNLKNLNCSNNQIQKVTFHETSQIKELSVEKNLLSDLPLKTLPELTYLNINSNKFSELNLDELLYLESLDCDNNELISLNLINNKFVKSISCRNNQISKIDFKEFQYLETLLCSNNKFSELDLTLFPKLSRLEAEYNNLLGLDFSYNKNIKEVILTGNKLKTLLITNKPDLDVVSAAFNELEVVDLENCSVISTLKIDNNTINLLNIKGCHKLYDIDASNNRIKFLDLSDQTESENDYFNFNNNQIVNLIIKNGKRDSFFYGEFLSTNLDIEYVCVDDFEGDVEKEDIYYTLLDFNYPKQVQINSYCSFDSSPNLTIVNGIFKYNNGECHEVDYGLNINLNIQTSVDISKRYNFINENKYNIALSQGKFKLIPNVENSDMFEIEPKYLDIDSNIRQNINQNFCISPKGTQNDLEVVITPIEAARPGFNASYKIVYKNKGNQIQSGQVALQFNEDLLDYVSSSPAFNSSDNWKIIWDFKDLKPFETRSINVVFNVNSPLDTPAVNNGDILKYTTQIITSAIDATPNDNAFELNQVLVGSYDPNDKTCLEGDVILPEMVGEYVHYKIRFENTGNYFAQNVVVEDFIDVEKFDVSSLVVLNSSHDQKTRIENNKVVFYFEDIKLPATPSPDRHGYVLFKIKNIANFKIK